jgi:hypothetical protein
MRSSQSRNLVAVTVLARSASLCSCASTIHARPGGRDEGKDMVFSARPTPNDGSVICTVLSAHFVDNTIYAYPQAVTATSSP